MPNAKEFDRWMENIGLICRVADPLNLQHELQHFLFHEIFHTTCWFMEICYQASVSSLPNAEEK